MGSMTSHAAGYAFCVAAAFASAAATFLIKQSTVANAGWTLARLLWLGAACGSYALGFVFYSMALQRLQMSLAYPLMTAVTTAVVALAGYLVWQESLGMAKLLGFVLLAAGAFLIAR
ncbi:SMR family transporter [Massilia sp. METH4]|uniref:SMR family transporter n=1 Tax=Massilia sp. METH4 TaxID=3123041 RepID=UPI0030D1C7B9